MDCKNEWAILTDADYPTVCLAAVCKKNLAIDFVTEANRMPEVYLRAAQQSGWTLSRVPVAQRTPEICVAAVRQNPWSAQFVPENLREKTKDELPLYQEQAAPDENCAGCDACTKKWALSRVPVAQRTPEICVAAVRQNGLALEFVPVVYRTPDVCMAAARNRRGSLDFVPDSQLTPEIIQAARAQNPWVKENDYYVQIY